MVDNVLADGAPRILPIYLYPTARARVHFDLLKVAAISACLKVCKSKLGLLTVITLLQPRRVSAKLSEFAAQKHFCFEERACQTNGIGLTLGLMLLR